MPAFGYIPRFRKGQRQLSADRMNSWADITRSLMRHRGGANVESGVTGGGAWYSVRPRVRPHQRAVVAPAVRLVRVTLVEDTSSLHGDATTPCGYLYDVFEYGGVIGAATQLASSLAPNNRPTIGWFDFVPEPGTDPAYSFGTAFQDPNDNDNWKLREVDGEVIHPIACDCTCV